MYQGSTPCLALIEAGGMNKVHAYSCTGSYLANYNLHADNDSPFGIACAYDGY